MFKVRWYRDSSISDGVFNKVCLTTKPRVVQGYQDSCMVFAGNRKAEEVWAYQESVSYRCVAVYVILNEVMDKKIKPIGIGAVGGSSSACHLVRISVWFVYDEMSVTFTHW
jgi:hypothetical protein